MNRPCEEVADCPGQCDDDEVGGGNPPITIPPITTVDPPTVNPPVDPPNGDACPCPCIPCKDSNRRFR